MELGEGPGDLFALKSVTGRVKVKTERARTKRSWVRDVNCKRLFISLLLSPFYCSLVKRLKHKNNLLPFSSSSDVTEKDIEPWIQIRFLHYQLQASVLCLKWPTGEAAKYNV